MLTGAVLVFTGIVAGSLDSQQESLVYCMLSVYLSLSLSLYIYILVIFVHTYIYISLYYALNSCV